MRVLVVEDEKKTASFIRKALRAGVTASLDRKTLELTWSFEGEPPAGIEVVSWYVVMGIGHALLDVGDERAAVAPATAAPVAKAPAPASHQAAAQHEPRMKRHAKATAASATDPDEDPQRAAGVGDEGRAQPDDDVLGARDDGRRARVVPHRLLAGRGRGGRVSAGRRRAGAPGGCVVRHALPTGAGAAADAPQAPSGRTRTIRLRRIMAHRRYMRLMTQ